MPLFNTNQQISSPELEDRYSKTKLVHTSVVTASGDTSIITPSSGKSIKMYWISAINDPDSSTSPLITIKIGTTSYYKAYAIAHWEIFTGAVNDSLIINLDEAGSVAITVHYEEV
jgi:hypothetical protein